MMQADWQIRSMAKTDVFAFIKKSSDSVEMILWMIQNNFQPGF